MLTICIPATVPKECVSVEDVSCGGGGGGVGASHCVSSLQETW